MAQIKTSTFCGGLCGIWFLIILIAAFLPNDSNVYWSLIELDAYFMIACFCIIPVGIPYIRKHNREEQYRPVSPPPYIAPAPIEPSFKEPIPSQKHVFEIENNIASPQLPSDPFPPKQPPHASPDQIFCRSCGTGNTPNAQYCFACGEKMH